LQALNINHQKDILGIKLNIPRLINNLRLPKPKRFLVSSLRTIFKSMYIKICRMRDHSGIYKTSKFWDIMPCCPFKIKEHFG
jgi:hypothetical protein